ncbi:MAG TPA: purine-nucleoside phosphorylase [Terriglobales bacterium]|nr:purine-nucleoside phosphorylase [Terriglobales bacterium]
MKARAKKHELRDYEQAGQAAKFIRTRTKLAPKIAVVLGSGLGSFADELPGAARIPYAKIPHFPHSTAIGHAGKLVIAKVGQVPVALMQGRVHFYEGYSLPQVVFPIRVLGRLGVEALILTNAAGGINTSYKQGALVVLRDHINLQGSNPLMGANDERFGVRFPDLTMAYDRALRKIALEQARRIGIDVSEGVYVAVTGPSYETPAEIRAFRTLDADVVGMSTVPEAITARHMGMRVLAISCVTNMAAGILDQPLDHKEVLETGERVKGQFVALLEAVIPEIANELEATKG